MGARSGGRSRVGLGVAAGVVVVLLVVWWIGTSTAARPLDPESHEPLGTSALVALLDELGADVTVEGAAPGPGGGADVDRFDVILVLRDHLEDSSRTRLSSWVRSGGVLVVADPASEFAPLATIESGGGSGPDDAGGAGQLPDDDVDGPTTRIPKGECGVQALDHADVEALEITGWETYFEVTDREQTQSCFGDDLASFVLATSRGEGTEVVLGGAGMWTNQALGNADNAFLAAALLAPQSGTRVGVLDPTARTAPGSGEESLWDVAPAGMRRALIQVGLAVVVYALWRGRRLGKPVAEPQPVKVASSELVAAVGGLLERSGSPQHAADMLRSDLRRELVGGLGLSADLPPETFFRVVESRCRSLDPHRLRMALGPGPVTSDVELVAVVQNIDVVRKEVLESVGT